MWTIVLIGPGQMPIGGNTKWGAVENLIHSYQTELTKLGHTVYIVNSQNPKTIVEQVRYIRPDVVHIQYDDFGYLASQLGLYAKLVFLTSHFAYLDQPSRWGSGYLNVWNSCLGVSHDVSFGITRNMHDKKIEEPAYAGKIFHLALSQRILEIYQSHGASNVFITPNGAHETKFQMTEIPKYPDRSICVAKIEARKRQHVLLHNPSVYFAGPIASNSSFPPTHPTWLGEWDRERLYTELTQYGNMVLLSDGEAHSLAVVEALMSGLGVVLSECATANLGPKPYPPWISVVNAKQMYQRGTLDAIIAENRTISIQHRKEIRQFAERRFSWTRLTERYTRLVGSLLGEPKIAPRADVTIVTCYFRIPSKQSHDFYLGMLRHFLPHVIHKCVCWTTTDLLPELKAMASPMVRFETISPDLPLEDGFDIPFWERQLARDAESYHTIPLARIWSLKKWFVLETAKRLTREIPEYHNFIWCDAGAVRSEASQFGLHQLGERWVLEDHRLHVQELKDQTKRVLHGQDRMYSPPGGCYSHPTQVLACGILFGTKQAWQRYQELYHKVLVQYDREQVSACSDQYVTLTCMEQHPEAFYSHPIYGSDPDAWFRFLTDI